MQNGFYVLTTRHNRQDLSQYGTHRVSVKTEPWLWTGTKDSRPAEDALGPHSLCLGIKKQARERGMSGSGCQALSHHPLPQGEKQGNLTRGRLVCWLTALLFVADPPHFHVSVFHDRKPLQCPKGRGMYQIQVFLLQILFGIFYFHFNFLLRF